MPIHVVAIISAFWYSLRYIGMLAIKRKEIGRYFVKSINLALCYVGLSPNRKLNAAILAGKAGFLCCAYDVVTDWKGFSPQSFSAYQQILLTLVSPELADLAIKLYHAEIRNNVGDDGLERGVVALTFIARLMEVEKALKEKCNIAELGAFLQIVDDVLDYEHDLKHSELNCLGSEGGKKYLIVLLEKSSAPDMDRIFPNGLILKHVIKKARLKAECLLA